MVFSVRRLQKVTNREPHALTTGELRDRAFAFAEKAGVKLKQVYVLPTRKARMANACASQGNNILLTDYLLEHLSKGEVDAVLAHELAHLKQRHPGLLLLTLIAGMATAGVLTGRLDSLFHSLPEGSLLPVTILAGLAVFHLVARRFERRADTAAVQLTNDPEALIRALAKITTLNRFPIHWGKLQGKLLTHPSTLQRARTLARQAEIPEERLTQILSSSEEPLDRYPVPPTSTPEGKAFSTTFKTNLSFRLACWVSDRHFYRHSGACSFRRNARALTGTALECPRIRILGRTLLWPCGSRMSGECGVAWHLSGEPSNE